MTHTDAELNALTVHTAKQAALLPEIRAYMLELTSEIINEEIN